MIGLWDYRLSGLGSRVGHMSSGGSSQLWWWDRRRAVWQQWFPIIGHCLALADIRFWIYEDNLIIDAEWGS
jgi:hypothetical protein